MELFPFLALVAFLCAFFFHAGKYSKEYPSEEEMIRRIKQIRRERKLKSEADAEFEKELQP